LVCHWRRHLFYWQKEATVVAVMVDIVLMGTELQVLMEALHRVPATKLIRLLTALRKENKNQFRL
jgi:hypothetical protein